MEVLLGPSDVNPNEPGGDCEAPTPAAATAGYKGVVEILVGRSSVNSSEPGNYS